MGKKIKKDIGMSVDLAELCEMVRSELENTPNIGVEITSTCIMPFYKDKNKVTVTQAKAKLFKIGVKAFHKIKEPVDKVNALSVLSDILEKIEN